MNYGGEPDDYLELYQDGKLSLDAKTIYQILRERGPSSTTILRRQSGLLGEGNAWARFERALTELQHGLMITVVGVARDNAWKYTFKYATLLDAFPAEVAAAREISRRQAMGRVLAHYVHLVGACSPREAARLFNWNEERCLHAARDLAASGDLMGEPASALSLLVAPEAVSVLSSSA